MVKVVVKPFGLVEWEINIHGEADPKVYFLDLGLAFFLPHFPEESSVFSSIPLSI
ncbi:hypothetical protein [Bacillus weihaiensis]|uniref:hypothetical protein n=1 Tax=Bacillus weihaiensis TaxID=1547283 RepID=UPI0023542EBB|nr:hypothetical protein [Bacillus weihaiensis]